MKRIILPTDFSETSMNAIRYALRMFEKEPCTFYLLNTFTPAAYHVPAVQLNSYSALQLEQIVSKRSKMQLDEVLDQINKEFINPKHIFVTLAVYNLLASEIVNLSETHNIDLVVMGTTGATGAKEVFMGTQTMHTIKKVKCPVIAVPANFDYETPKEMLLTTDFKFDAKNRYFPLLKELSENHVARVNILNAYYGEPLDEMQEANKDFLNSYFKSTAHLFHSAEDIGLVEAVEAFQVKHKVNFLVMIHNRHNFFENLLFKPVINQIAYHTKVPFMVIPSEDRMRH
jgi:nucleotide-binding universal stress UspA family protein